MAQQVSLFEELFEPIKLEVKPDLIEYDVEGYPCVNANNLKLFLTAMGPRANNKLMQMALQFGLFKPFWTLQHYLQYAAQYGKYATVLNWAEQSSGKSNRLLQQGYWILKDWDKVLSNLVFRPRTFVDKLKAVPKGRRLSWTGWDDLGVHLPSSTYRTDVKMYEAIDSAWAAIRVKCSVISITIPLIDRTVKAIKDNISHEVYMGPNQMEIVERIVRLPSYRDTESIMAKICIEGPAPFDLYTVPTDVFKEYWEMREQLTEEALGRLGDTIEEESSEGYISILDAATDLGVSAGYLAQYVSRGVVEGKLFKGIRHISLATLEELKKNKSKADSLRKRKNPANLI